MAQDNATRCACYEDMKGSTAYFIGLMDGREEACAKYHELRDRVETLAHRVDEALEEMIGAVHGL